MAELIGQRLGQYEIIAMLGKGGMASVYRARQHTIKRDVAIKVIQPRGAESQEYLKRFERETFTTGQLSHAHIVKVFDFGIQEPYVFLVMELLTGGSAEDLLLKGPLPVGRVAEILEQIGSALDYAHGKGVIHRDLKPANILFDEAGNCFLTDFGIVKVLEETSALTEHGSIVGTPAYISPELWRGQAISPQADIYSLGVLAFEMLTGIQPFRADTIYGMMKAHVNQPPPSILNSLPSLPHQLDKVIARALAKHPAERYQTAGELAEMFTRAISASQAQPEAKSMSESTIRLPPTVPEPKKAAPPPAPKPAVPPVVSAAPADPSLTMPLPSVQADVRAIADDEHATQPPVISSPLPRQALAPAPPRKRSQNLPIIVIGVGLIAALGIIILLLFAPRGEQPAELAAEATRTAQTATALAAAPSDTPPPLLVVNTATTAPTSPPQPTSPPTHPPTLTLTSTATPTLAPTSTREPSHTPSNTPSSTPTTPAPTSTHTSTATAQPTDTPAPSHTPTALPTETPPPTPTSTPLPSDTPPPTATPQQIAAVDLEATQVSALIRSAQPAFGPVSGTLTHTGDDKMVSTQAGVFRDFVAEARFTNPYGPERGKWDYGFVFRDVLGDQYRLIVASSGGFALVLWQGALSGNAQAEIIYRGSLPQDVFDVSAGESNLLRLVVKGADAYFYVGDHFVTGLDVSKRQESGSLWIATGIQGKDYQIKGSKTEFADFAVADLK